MLHGLFRYLGEIRARGRDDPAIHIRFRVDHDYLLWFDFLRDEFADLTLIERAVANIGSRRHGQDKAHASIEPGGADAS
jgi:hypothetical protein